MRRFCLSSSLGPVHLSLLSGCAHDQIELVRLGVNKPLSSRDILLLYVSRALSLRLVNVHPPVVSGSSGAAAPLFSYCSECRLSPWSGMCCMGMERLFALVAGWIRGPHHYRLGRWRA